MTTLQFLHCFHCHMNFWFISCISKPLLDFPDLILKTCKKTRSTNMNIPHKKLLAIRYSSHYVKSSNFWRLTSFIAICLISTYLMISIVKLQPTNPPVDLYLNFEKSSLKNKNPRFFIFQFEKIWKDHWMWPKISGYWVENTLAQVRNRLKIQFVVIDFSKLIFQKSSTYQ